MYERTFREGIKAQREAEAKLDASEQPTEEFEPVQLPPTRLQRLGGFLLKGLQAMGEPYARGYGSARMGYIPPYQPEQPQQLNQDESHITRGEE